MPRASRPVRACAERCAAPLRRALRALLALRGAMLRSVSLLLALTAVQAVKLKLPPYSTQCVTEVAQAEGDL